MPYYALSTRPPMTSFPAVHPSAKSILHLAQRSPRPRRTRPRGALADPADGPCSSSCARRAIGGILRQKTPMSSMA